MQYKYSLKKTSIICNLLFAVFSFIYLFYYQTDILYSFHYSLSRTESVYSSLGNSIVITVVLMIIRWGLNQFTRLRGIVSAISYFPAFLVLGVLTDFDESIFTSGGINSVWKWLLPVSLLVYLIFAYSFRRLFCLWIEKDRDYIVTLNVNIAIFTFLSIMTIYIANTKKEFHQLTRIERAFVNEDYSLAEKVGYNSKEASRGLTAIRNFTLAKEGEMGEKMFEYPQYYGVDGLYLDDSKNMTQIVNNDSISKFIGITNKLNRKLFASLDKLGKKNKKAADYYLSYLLLSKNLKKFAEVLPIYNNASIDSLPKHYKEAILLDAYLEKKEMPETKNEELKKEFDDFISRKEDTTQPELNKKEIFIKYGKTYWWYYIN